MASLFFGKHGAFAFPEEVEATYECIIVVTPSALPGCVLRSTNLACHLFLYNLIFYFYFIFYFWCVDT